MTFPRTDPAALARAIKKKGAAEADLKGAPLDDWLKALKKTGRVDLDAWLATRGDA